MRATENSAPARKDHRRPPRDFARERQPAKISGFSKSALRMDLVLRCHRGAEGDARFSVSGRLPLPGRDIRATAVHADLYTAIVQMFESLVRRSQDGKTQSGNLRTPRRKFCAVRPPRSWRRHTWSRRRRGPGRSAIAPASPAEWDTQWTAWRHYSPSEPGTV